MRCVWGAFLSKNYDFKFGSGFRLACLTSVLDSHSAEFGCIRFSVSLWWCLTINTKRIRLSFRSGCDFNMFERLRCTSFASASCPSGSASFQVHKRRILFTQMSKSPGFRPCELYLHASISLHPRPRLRYVFRVEAHRVFTDLFCTNSDVSRE